jgi:hypothetical protein
MDLHAHILRTEVIGLLGGSFNEETKQLEIRCAFPCRGASTDFQVTLLHRIHGSKLLTYHPIYVF